LYIAPDCTKIEEEEKHMSRGVRVSLFAALVLLGAAISASAVGLTFSCFLPRGGRFSQPVYPLSVQDAGLSLGRYFRVAGSLSLYSIAGMGIADAEGMPLKFEGPATGAFQSVLGSLVGQVIIPIKVRQMVRVELVGSGGVFGCCNFTPPLLDGPLEEYLAAEAAGGPYEAVSTSLDSDGRWGWGWVFGGSATYYIGAQLGLTVGARYYLGGAPLRLSGSFDGYNSGAPARHETVLPAALRGARLDFTGLELLAGISYHL
jgi:hypothetical protein